VRTHAADGPSRWNGPADYLNPQPSTLNFDRLIKEGEIDDQADLARLGSVSRARVTQIMNLLQLTPEIQEALLFLPRTERGRDPIRERHIRPIAAILDWQKQREKWARLAKIKCVTCQSGCA
jgi:hypothetical protein